MASATQTHKHTKLQTNTRDKEHNTEQ